MNTKSLLTRIAVPVLGLGLLGGAGATLATSASASTLATTLSANVKPDMATVVASTQVNNVPDTTSGTVTSDPGTGNGYVWAHDNLTRTFRVTPTGGGHYTVTELVNGTFSAFSQPNTGLSYDSPLVPNVDGQMHGTNTYYVSSPTPPDPANLPAQELDGTGTGTVIGQLFHNHQTDDGGQSGNLWVFSYHAAGGSMTQRYDTPPSDWGNITGH